MGKHWTNWGRNQDFAPQEIVRPASEDEAIELMATALRKGRKLRVCGSGHSFTPIVETSGVLFDLSQLSGVISVDRTGSRADVRAGTAIAALGEPLWLNGLSIANQGDIDVQTIAGATATGTKGSGKDFGSISSGVTNLRIIDGRGEVVDIDSSNMERLLAGQVSLGLLGAVLRVGLQLVPAYGLKEENQILPMSELLRQWDFLLGEYRHFSFWWMPSDRSAYMYKLGNVSADHCFVKLLREVPASGLEGPPGPSNRRTDRAYRIYPDGTTEAEFHELEYMIGSEHAKEAVNVLRDLMLRHFPDEISPLQVRWQKRDKGFLSAQNGRDSTSLSVSGEIGKPYLPFLKAVDAALRPYGARPHWGKIHFLDRERAEEIYPNFSQFEKVRRELDPDGLFLNSHLKDLFVG